MSEPTFAQRVATLEALRGHVNLVPLDEALDLLACIREQQAALRALNESIQRDPPTKEKVAAALLCNDVLARYELEE